MPAQVAHLLRRYLSETRPWLIARGGQHHDYLWVDNRGAPFFEFKPFREKDRDDYNRDYRSSCSTPLLPGCGSDDPRTYVAGGSAVDSSGSRTRSLRDRRTPLYSGGQYRGWSRLRRGHQAYEEGKMMTRVAIYARFSTEMQRDASIEDQIRLCRERADREGWRVVETFTDRALSGASMLRPGLQSLIEGATAGRFEIILAEALDRLSRDQADIAALYKRLSFADVQIVTLSEGEISELHVGLKGTMNSALPQGSGREDPARAARSG